MGISYYTFVRDYEIKRVLRKIRTTTYTARKIKFTPLVNFVTLIPP